jgi:2,3-bisphosphoglycerate-independent phosphoglycerate mutase
LLGLEVINVPGATGYYDTDYEAKAKAATKALKNKDFVFVHVEAPDEAGHVGDLKEKITAIERFDHYVVGELLSVLQNDNDLRLMVLPDHPTPLSVRTHTREPVPFAVAGHGISRGSFSCFSEREAHKGGILFVKGYMLTRHFLTPSHAF